MVIGCRARPSNDASTDGLGRGIVGRRSSANRLRARRYDFRGDAAFAEPEVYEASEERCCSTPSVHSGQQ